MPLIQYARQGDGDVNQHPAGPPTCLPGRPPGHTSQEAADRSVTLPKKPSVRRQGRRGEPGDGGEKRDLSGKKASIDSPAPRPRYHGNGKSGLL